VKSERLPHPGGSSAKRKWYMCIFAVLLKSGFKASKSDQPLCDDRFLCDAGVGRSIEVARLASRPARLVKCHSDDLLTLFLFSGITNTISVSDTLLAARVIYLDRRIGATPSDFPFLGASARLTTASSGVRA
jgi:hypothetical protein